MTDYRTTLNPATGRIYRALLAYMPSDSAAARAVEIERRFRKQDFTDAIEMVSEILGRLDENYPIPAEILDRVAHVVIRAWNVVEIDRG